MLNLVFRKSASKIGTLYRQQNLTKVVKSEKAVKSFRHILEKVTCLIVMRLTLITSV